MEKNEIFEPETLILEDEDRRSGFTQVDNWLLLSDKISRDAKLLYTILLSYAYQKDHCFPGYARLQGDMPCGSALLAKCIKDLKDKGLISVKRRGQGKTSIYTIKKGMSAKFSKSGNQSSSSFKNKEQATRKSKREEYEPNKQSINSRKKRENEVHTTATDDLAHIPPAARKFFRGKQAHLVIGLTSPLEQADA